eukprot:Lithocolla_globosa_v1_NODE_262_length_4766_cov_108.495648.p3 type:complete len:112 gc:universal NODE_262_length_4766_cov_108.495648:1374-1039(-)
MVRSCVTFMGKADQHNEFHNINAGRGLDRRRLEEAYFKWMVLCWNDEFNLQWNLDFRHFSTVLLRITPILLKAFTAFWVSLLNASDLYLVTVDGHMKCTRKVCASGTGNCS